MSEENHDHSVHSAQHHASGEAQIHHHNVNETHTAKKRSSMRPLQYAAIAAVVIIIVAVALLVGLHPSKKVAKINATTTTGVLPITTSIESQPSGPRELRQPVATNDSPAALAYLSSINNYTPSIPNFTVKYAGMLNSSTETFVLNKSGALAGYLAQPSSINNSVRTTYEKLGSEARSTTNLTVNSISGPESEEANFPKTINSSTYYLTNGTYYTCTSAPEYNCTVGNKTTGSYLGSDPLFFLRNFTVSNLAIRNSSYMGWNCTNINGEMALNETNVQFDSQFVGNFSACIIKPYSTALYMNISMHVLLSSAPAANGSTEDFVGYQKTSVHVLNLTNESSAKFVESFNKSVLKGGA